jgi:uncharacterized membrane protein
MKLSMMFMVGALALGAGMVGAQEVEVTAGEALFDPGVSAVQSLEALERSLELKERELAGKLNELSAATEDSLREDLRRQVRELRSVIDEQRRQFDGFAADIDVSVFSPREPEKFDWQEQVGKLLQPIMAELENATKESRLIGQLRAQIEDVRKRRDLAQEAVDNLRTLLQQAVSPQLKERLSGRLQEWEQILAQADSEFTALDLQLQSRLAARESVLDASTNYARHFFRTRGLNLFLGILAFLAVFFGFRIADRMVRKSRLAKGEETFSSRLTTLLFHLFSVLGGLLAMMIVFNVAGDWFLLGIIIIFLIGVGWAGIKTLPAQIETVKLMLNIGAVKEGEALVFDECVYRVDALGFSARLSNPRLEGSHRVLPVKYLVDKTSRIPGPDELWFPTEKGDWVEVANGVAGQVKSQTPGSVELALIGGATASYRTNDFLTLNPKTLSGGFRIEEVFGIDYAHQAIVTSEVPAKMKAALESALKKSFDAAWFRDIKVIFARAGASSLDFSVVLDVNGDAAPMMRELRAAMQAALVDLCGSEGWGIPFPQLTVHQAK